MKDNNQMVSQLINQLKRCYNIILTGAPGTGKTFLAHQIATNMILGKDDLDGLTDDEMALLKEHVGFVQFHQSYDYTDFVEGMRPVQKYDKDGGKTEIVFERKDGIFKEFCKAANKANIKQLVADEYQNAFQEIKNEDLKGIPVGKGNIKKTFYEETGNWGLTSGTIRANGKKGDVAYLASIEKLIDYGFIHKSLLEDYEGNMRDIIGGNDTDIRNVLCYLFDRIEKRNATSNKPPYIFIIDEINRGELSKIFGELFFSIDPGYRGETKKRIKTQYQNLVESGDVFEDGFYVPNNIYIIGTMNDIDRSIERMDFAIRRRFAWLEVKADDTKYMLASLKDNKLQRKAEAVMDAVNRKIDQIDGLGSSYHIGASYFLKLRDTTTGENITFTELWNYHIKNVIREYLRGIEVEDADEKAFEKIFINADKNSNMSGNEKDTTEG